MKRAAPPPVHETTIHEDYRPITRPSRFPEIPDATLQHLFGCVPKVEWYVTESGQRIARYQQEKM